MKRIFVANLAVNLLIVGLCIFGSQAFAHNPSTGQVHAAFGPFVYQAHRDHHYFKNPMRAGFGMVVDADVDKHGGLELTMIYVKQTFSMKKGSQLLTEQGKRMYIGMGYRTWINDEFSIAPTFFSSYLMGDAQVRHTDFTLPDPPSTSARDTVEYGVDLSLQYETLKTRNFAVLFDVRYAYSLTPKPGEDGNFYGCMIAFKYFIQGKQPDDVEDF